MSWSEQALKKLAEEQKSGNYDRHASAMKAQVRETLENFCRQDEEFAQAVVRGGTFEGCMKAVAKNCGCCISDLDAYTRAVRYYFPGATIRFQMVLDLAGDAAAPEDAPVVLNLADFW